MVGVWKINIFISSEQFSIRVQQPVFESAALLGTDCTGDRK